MGKVLNLDGLVGPSHHYGGLADGNLASKQHKGRDSSPREAALQGLEKMWTLHNLGIPQGFLPPHPRPNLALLYSAGFSGDTENVLDQAFKQAPLLLQACYSASSMWAANAATISASIDTLDNKLHITPANLITGLHRSQEAESNTGYLHDIFANASLFNVHKPLPPHLDFADEGAANHIRLHDPQGDGALNLFVYGRSRQQTPPARYPIRQSLLASESIMRRHHLSAEHTLFIQQGLIAINHGAFHNDVVAVGHENILLLHEAAWENQTDQLKKLKAKTKHWQSPLHIYEITHDQLSLEDAIQSYLFNSQLVTNKEGNIVMLAPQECLGNKAASDVCDQLLTDSPIEQIIFMDLRQSMDNGGGPACLRLAVPITEHELTAVNPRFLLTEARYAELKNWIKQHYRDRLSFDDLRDPLFKTEIDTALKALTSIGLSA